MTSLDRRKLLHAGIAFAVPLGSMPLLSGLQESAKKASNDETLQEGETKNSVDKNPKQENKGKTMQIQYLEIVTSDADALCKQYSAIHGCTFSDPVMNLGNARIADLKGGGKLAIRGPLRPDETPVIRPYVLVEDVEKAVAAAKDAGAEVAIPKMEIPGHGTIGIVIQGGIECGLWQNLE